MPFARTLAFRHFDVFRGGPDEEGAFVEFSVPVEEGMVVLDALHWIQANGAPDLAVRWNCKAAKCGSCSAEGNGMPSLTWQTRLTDPPPDPPRRPAPRRPLELQGGQVRVVQRRGERHAVAHLQDAHHRPAIGPAHPGGA